MPLIRWLATTHREDTTVDGEALVRDYLGRLEAAAWPLSPDRKSELVGEVREHIEAALVEASARDEVTVRNVLERLGRPEDIVAEEAGAAPVASPTPGVPAASTSPFGAIEIIALLLLTVGAVLIPIFGPILGLFFVWASTRWTRREKLVATAIVVLLIVIPILGMRAGPGFSGMTEGVRL
jgi:uncharacterized membrane protein